MLTPREIAMLAERMAQAKAEGLPSTLKRREVGLVESLLHALLSTDEAVAVDRFKALRQLPSA